ncbi:MAG: hypothetical protein PHS17_06355 [Desulfobacterales bacterium]|nr:hypothetical protein [Desulfobacterales bacterium]
MSSAAPMSKNPTPHGAALMHTEGVKFVALLSPEYWNVGIVAYWEVITQNRKMNVLQNGLMRFEAHHSTIPLFQYSKDLFSG